MKLSPPNRTHRTPGAKQQGNSFPLYAALDLGTNNCRMLIARKTRHGFHVVDSFSRITRLGQNLGRENRLCTEAMDRTLKALQVCARKLEGRDVQKVRCVATEACRRAENGDEFIHRVHSETGIQIETIKAEEEAKLALTGCSSLLNLERPKALVFDIGGGSTEIMWIELQPSGDPKLLDVISLPMGVVTIYEKYRTGLDLPLDAYNEIISEVKEAVAPFETRNLISDDVCRARVQMLGTSGTVTTLGAVHLDLPKYLRSKVDGMTLSLDKVNSISKRLSLMSCDERAAHPCIGRNRADLVIAGCAILEGLCSLWPVPELTIADRGIREGILINLMKQNA